MKIINKIKTLTLYIKLVTQWWLFYWSSKYYRQSEKESSCALTVRERYSWANGGTDLEMVVISLSTSVCRCLLYTTFLLNTFLLSVDRSRYRFFFCSFTQSNLRFWTAVKDFQIGCCVSLQYSKNCNILITFASTPKTSKWIEKRS